MLFQPRQYIMIYYDQLSRQRLFCGGVPPTLIENWRRGVPSAPAAADEVISRASWNTIKIHSDSETLLERAYLWVSDPPEKPRLKVFVAISMDRYDPWRDYQRAKARKNAISTPHGFFWGLPLRKHTYALKFFKEF